MVLIDVKLDVIKLFVKMISVNIINLLIWKRVLQKRWLGKSLKTESPNLLNFYRSFQINEFQTESVYKSFEENYCNLLFNKTNNKNWSSNQLKSMLKLTIILKLRKMEWIQNINGKIQRPQKVRIAVQMMIGTFAMSSKRNHVLLQFFQKIQLNRVVD